MDNEPRPLLAHPGGRRVKGQKQADNRNYGNSRSYLEARLTRDALEGVQTAAALLQGVHNGTISLYAAATEMNYTRRREPNGRGSQNMARARDWKLYRLLNPRRPDPKAAAEK
jgi:hypothetical protein